MNDPAGVPGRVVYWQTIIVAVECARRDNHPQATEAIGATYQTFDRRMARSHMPHHHF